MPCNLKRSLFNLHVLNQGGAHYSHRSGRLYSIRFSFSPVYQVGKVRRSGFGEKIRKRDKEAEPPCPNKKLNGGRSRNRKNNKQMFLSTFTCRVPSCLMALFQLQNLVRKKTNQGNRTTLFCGFDRWSGTYPVNLSSSHNWSGIGMSQESRLPLVLF